MYILKYDGLGKSRLEGYIEEEIFKQQRLSKS